MADFSDTWAEYKARIKRAQNSCSYCQTADIVTSNDLTINEPLPPEGPNIKREQIGWLLDHHAMYYIVTVKRDAVFKKHSHDEDIFRFVFKGSLTVNGISIKKGMWFVVRANAFYGIHTKTGYTALAGYMKKCSPAHLQPPPKKRARGK